MIKRNLIIGFIAVALAFSFIVGLGVKTSANNSYATGEDIIQSQEELTGSVNITGSYNSPDGFFIDEVLKANIENCNSTNLLYQWKRNNEDIENATNSTYKLTSSDISNTISVVVSSTDKTGSFSATTSIIKK